MINDSPLSQQFYKTGRVDYCPIIDIHGHMEPLNSIWMPNASPQKMVQTMDLAGIQLMCFSHHYPLQSPDVSNKVALEAAQNYPERLRVYLAVNPHYPDITDKDLKNYDSYSKLCIGFKLHASWHGVSLDHSGYQRTLAFANERKLLVLAHTWCQSDGDGPIMVRKLAQRYQDLKFILGHSLHGDWDEAINMANDFANVYLDLTAVLDDRGIVEKFIAAGLTDKLLFGTDLPWFNPHYCIGALLSADISDSDRHNILHRNAEHLLELM